MSEPETPITLTDTAAAKILEIRDADETTKGEAAGPLATCVRDTYDRIEPTCVTKSSSEADRREV